jgi:hypothetical protein
MTSGDNDPWNEELIRELFRPNAPVKIEYNDSCGKVIPFDASVSSYNSSLELVMKDNGLLDLIRIGNNLILVMFCENGKTIYYFSTKVLGIQPGPPQILRLFRPVRTNVSALRGFFRCDVSLSFIYILEGVLEFKGEIKNLSAGGLLGAIKYDSTLTVDMVIDVRFSLPALRKPLMLSAQIVRIEPGPNHKTQHIAVKFLKIKESEQNQIVKYLFQCQRELKTKRALV